MDNCVPHVYIAFYMVSADFDTCDVRLYKAQKIGFYACISMHLDKNHVSLVNIL